MGHPIHKHMGGMKSAERYDAKEAYNKDLSSKARMHYLENDIADKKGSPARMDDSYGDSPTEFNKGLRDASAAGKLDDNPNFKAKVDASMSRKSSPANNINYGTGYIGEQRADDMKYNPVDDITQGKGKANYGVSFKSDAQRKAVHASKAEKAMSRKASPLNEYGGKKGDESKSKRDY